MFINKIDFFIDKLLNEYYKYIQNKKIKYQLDEINNNTINFIEKNLNSILFDILDIKSIKDIKEFKQYSITYILYFIYIFKFINDINIDLYKKTEYYNKFEQNIINITDIYSNYQNKEIKLFYTANEINLLKLVFKTTYDIILIQQINVNSDKINQLDKESIDFWNNISDDIKKKIFLKKEMILFNTIKLVIIKIIHNNNRSNLFNLLLDKTSEYRYIDVVIKKQQNIIDYRIIEKFFFENNILNQIVIDDLYDFIQTNELEIKFDSFNLSQLMENKILYPIVNNFIRYHRDTFRYDLHVNKIDKLKHTRINIAINRIINIKKFYNTKLSKEDKDQLLLLFSSFNRKSINYNDIEEIKIIKRIYEDNKNKIENELYEQFNNYKQYPYIYFDNDLYNSFKINSKNTLSAIRYCSIEHIDTFSHSSIENDTEYIVIPKNEDTPIIGLCITNKDISKINSKNIIVYNEITTEFKKNIKHIFFHKQPKNIPCILFKKTSDNISIIYLIKYITNIIYEYLYRKIFNKIKMISGKDYNYYFNIIKKYETKYFPLNKNSEQYIFLKKYIYRVLTKQKIERYDENNNKLINFKKNIIFKKDENNDNNYICQHFITLLKIKKTNKNTHLQEIFEHEYIKKYIEKIYDGDKLKYIRCKSCKHILNQWHFVEDGDYDDNNNFISFYSELNVSIRELQDYQNLNAIIDFLDIQIDKICEILDIPYYGYKRNIPRDLLIKELIDLVKFMKYYLKYVIDDVGKEYYQKMGLNFSYLFYIDLNKINLDDEINNDKNNIFKNILTAYCIYIILINISDSDIIFFRRDKKWNINIFNQIKEKLFNKINIYTIDNNTEKILNFNTLCYVIYQLSAIVIKEKMWIFENNKPNVKDHIAIIHSVIDIINRIYSIRGDINDLLIKIEYTGTSNTLYIKKIIEINKIKLHTKLKNIYFNKQTYNRIINNEKRFELNQTKSITNIELSDIISITEELILHKYKKNKIHDITSNKQIKNDKRVIDINYEIIKKNNKLFINSLYNYYCNKKINKVEYKNICNSSNFENKLFEYLNTKKINYIKNKIKFEKSKKQKLNEISEIEKIILKNNILNDSKIKNFVIKIGKDIYEKYRLKINIVDEYYILKVNYKAKKFKTPLIIYNNELKIIDNQILVYYFKKEKVYYYFNKDNLKLIKYKEYNKEIIKLDIKGNLIFLQKCINLYHKVKTLCLSQNCETNYIIKKIIRNTLKYLIIIKYDKLLRKYIKDKKYIIYKDIHKDKDNNTNIDKDIDRDKNKNKDIDKDIDKNKDIDKDDYIYSFLKKYIIDYNMQTIQLSKNNRQIFKNWKIIYNYIENLNKEQYTEQYNKLLSYYIDEINLLYLYNNNKNAEISLFIYDLLNNIYDYNNNQNTDFKQKIAIYLIESNQLQSFKILRDNVGDNDFNIYKENVINNTNETKMNIVEEDGYDIMDNDNDEDDMIESEFS